MISFQKNIKIFIVTSIIILIGCSGSQPRFRSNSTKTDTEEKFLKEYRFSSDVIKEETKEDDKKVDISSLKKEISKNNLNSSTRDKLLLEVMNMMGTPYSRGGRDQKGIDCSGFTKKIFYNTFGIELPPTTAEQFETGRNVSYSDLEFGDLVFFNTTGKNPSHVGIYLGDKLFAHASLSFGVTISSLESSYYKKKYTGARRILR